MSAAVRRLWLARLTGGAALLLVGATWPLWLPPTPESFPQLPLFAWLIPAPGWCDRVALAGMLAGATGMLWGGSSKDQEPKNQNDSPPGSERRSRPFLVLDFLVLKLPGFAPALFTASLAFALALNQIRIQVWAYQFLLLGAVLSLCPRTETGDRAAVTLARVLAVGILFHSGLSKLDLAFAEGPGRWLLGGFLSLFGVEAGGLSQDLLSAAAFAVPAWELGLSVLLAVPGLRRVGLIGAVFMHASVTATLWALDQSWGVLLWNGFFLAHEFVLFRPEPQAEGVPLWTTVRSAGRRTWPAAGLIAAAVTLPFGTRAGYWDVWPGWAVYAGGMPRGSAAMVIYPEDVPPQVARRMEPFLYGYENWTITHTAERSLEELRAPLPQDGRMHLGLAIAAAKRGDARLGEYLTRGTPQHGRPVFGRPRVILLSGLPPLTRRPAPSPNRWDADAATGWDEVNALADHFLLNARPRALSLPPEAR